MLDNLKRSVEGITAVAAAAVALIQGLHAKLEEAIQSEDMDQVQALADELDQAKESLAAAITANTPADPATPPADPAPTQGAGTADAGDTSGSGSASA